MLLQERDAKIALEVKECDIRQQISSLVSTYNKQNQYFLIASYTCVQFLIFVSYKGKERFYFKYEMGLSCDLTSVTFTKYFIYVTNHISVNHNSWWKIF